MTQHLKPVDGLKFCHKCDQWLALDCFYVDGKRQIYSPCKECRIKKATENSVEWRKKNILRHRKTDREYKLVSKYKLSIADLKALLEQQHSACAICKNEISYSAVNKADKPHVDHCHVTGVVRGLLCLTCNTGIGMFNDSTDLLDAAKEYLQRREASTLVEQSSEPESVITGNDVTIH